MITDRIGLHSVLLPLFILLTHTLTNADYRFTLHGIHSQLDSLIKGHG